MKALWYVKIQITPKFELELNLDHFSLCGGLKREHLGIIIIICICRCFVACACEDATITLIKLTNGAQICCPIVLDSRAAVLNSLGSNCMCITTGGYLYVWKYDMDEKINFNVNFNPAGSLLISSDTNGKKSNATNSGESSTDTNLFNLTTPLNQVACHFLLKGKTLSLQRAPPPTLNCDAISADQTIT
jgi:hypothetical protein